MSFLRPLALLPLLLLVPGCERKLSPEAQAAQDMAKSADQRVAMLEKELEEIKAAKNAPKDAHPDDVREVSKSQQKALERQLSEAKKRAEVKKQEALQIAAQPAPKEVPKAPIMVEVPTGAKVVVKPLKDLGTDSVQAGDSWEGTLAEDIVVGGQLVWPAGKPVRGIVTQSTPAGRLASGQGGLGIRLTDVGDISVDTDTHLVVGSATGERNAKMIGGGAALGALIGILSDHKNKNDHALGGAALGAAVGTAAAAGTANTVIRIKAESPVTFTLKTPERVLLRK